MWPGRSPPSDSSLVLEWTPSVTRHDLELIRSGWLQTDYCHCCGSCSNTELTEWNGSENSVLHHIREWRCSCGRWIPHQCDGCCLHLGGSQPSRWGWRLNGGGERGRNG